MMYVIDILLEIFDIYILYKLMHVFFVEPAVEKWTEKICYCLRTLFTLAIFEIASFPLLNILISIFGIFVLTWCYKAALSKRIVAVFLVYGIRFLSEAIVVVLMGIKNLHMLAELPEANEISLVLIELIQWFAIVVMRKYKHVDADVFVQKYLLVGIISVQVASIIMICLIVQQPYTDRSISVVALSCVIVLDMILIYLYDSFAKVFDAEIQLKLNEQEKEFYHNQVKLMNENQRELSQFRHDIKNKLFVLADLMKQNNMEKAEEYLGQLTKRLERTENYSQSENLVVDSILNYKLSQAEEQGIEVTLDVELPEQLLIEDDDIIVVLGNLLDNAMEAAGQVKDEKRIYISVKYDKGNLFIDVVNTYMNELKEEKGRLITNKKDRKRHGIGLQSVESVVEKYHGEKDMFYDEKEFQVNIVMCENM